MSNVPDMWNESLIRRIFNLEEANAILSIVFGCNSNPNRLIWHYTPDGEYSTKSGYRIAKGLLR